MQDIQKALIQQNNIRWINQKAMECANPPEPTAESKMEFEPILDSYLASGTACGGWKSRILGSYYRQPVAVAQSIKEISDSYLIPGSVESLRNSFRDMINFFEAPQNYATPSDCRSCKYFSGDQFLKCAVNPKRMMDDDCAEYEKLA